VSPGILPDYPDVTFDNRAEQMIRPAVILRKVSQSNRSEKGAAVQAVLMSVYRTLKLRGHHWLATIVAALRTYLTLANSPRCPYNPLQTGEVLQTLESGLGCVRW